MLIDILNASPIILILCMLSVCVAGSAFEWAVFWRIRRIKDVIEADIIKLEAPHTRKIESSAWLTLRYSVGDHVYENSLRINRKNYKQLQNTQTVPIRYLPNHPSIVRLAKENSDYITRNLVTIAALGCMIGFEPFIVLWPICFVICLGYLYAPPWITTRISHYLGR